MQTRLTQPFSPPQGDPLPIPPHQLWARLTPEQQRPLLQALVRLGHELVVAATRRPGREGSDE